VIDVAAIFWTASAIAKCAMEFSKEEEEIESFGVQALPGTGTHLRCGDYG
jgi:hypothetical protein